MNVVKQKSKAQRLKESKELEGELTSVEDKLFAADEALVEGRIARDSQQRMKQRYDREALRLRERLSEVQHTDDTLAERVTASANLFEVLPAVWREAMRRGDAEAVSDLLTSIAPEKMVYDGSVRTPFGSTAKALFGPESQKNENAEPFLTRRLLRRAREYSNSRPSDQMVHQNAFFVTLREPMYRTARTHKKPQNRP